MTGEPDRAKEADASGNAPPNGARTLPRTRDVAYGSWSCKNTQVPRTGQDTVLDAAALEREVHVRAPVVEGEHAPAVVDHEDRTIATLHEEPPLLFQLLEASREREVLVRRIHEHTSRSRPLRRSALSIACHTWAWLPAVRAR